LGEGVPLKQGRQRRVPLWRNVILLLLACLVWKQLQIGIDMLLIITSTGDRLFTFINIDDLERPWTSRSGGFGKFFEIFACSAHSKSELQQNG